MSAETLTADTMMMMRSYDQVAWPIEQNFSLEGRSVLFGGTFDPPTLGHLAVIKQLQRAAHIHVVIGTNMSKRPLFSLDERRELLERTLRSFSNVTIHTYEGALVKKAYDLGVDLLVRGIRNEDDYRKEITMAQRNGTLAPAISTLFIIRPEGNSDASSTEVRGGNYSHCPSEIIDQVHARVEDKNRPPPSGRLSALARKTKDISTLFLIQQCETWEEIRRMSGLTPYGLPTRI